MTIPIPAVGSTGWDVSVDAVINRVNELDPVDATSDADKPVSTAQQAALDLKLNTADAPELIRDTMGTALVAGSNVTITPNDGSDTITVKVTDDIDLPLGGQVNIGSSTSNAALAVNSTVDSTDVIVTKVDGEANNRFLMEVNGGFSWGPGTGAFDVSFRRNGTGQLRMFGNLLLIGSISASGHFTSTPVNLTDGASVALDASLGSYFRLSAAGNRTISVPTNPTDGQSITIEHLASGGARTLSLTTGSSGAFAFGTTITALTATTSGARDMIRAVYNSTAARWFVVGYVKGF